MLKLHRGLRAYLKHCHNGPKQGIKILSIWNCVSRISFQAELASKKMHAENARVGKKGDGRNILLQEIQLQ